MSPIANFRIPITMAPRTYDNTLSMREKKSVYCHGHNHWRIHDLSLKIAGDISKVYELDF